VVFPIFFVRCRTLLAKYGRAGILVALTAQRLVCKRWSAST
jgi:hypothetical protein